MGTARQRLITQKLLAASQRPGQECQQQLDNKPGHDRHVIERDSTFPYGTSYNLTGTSGDDVLIAGKTGTAQAARFSVPVRDERGQVVRDENGRVKRNFLEPSTEEKPNPQNPWYVGHGPGGKDLNHAWFIGYAPADHPQIAFAVLVEYGGSGGTAAAPIARDVLEACVEHGYLARQAR